MCILQATRNYRSVAQTVKRLEEAAISYRGPERVQLLRRWLVVLKEIEKLSEAMAEGKEKTLEQHLAVEEMKENPKRPSLVRNLPCIQSSYFRAHTHTHITDFRLLQIDNLPKFLEIL